MKPNENLESEHSPRGADSDKPVADQFRSDEQSGESSPTKPVDRTDVGGQVTSPLRLPESPPPPPPPPPPPAGVLADKLVPPPRDPPAAALGANGLPPPGSTHPDAVSSSTKRLSADDLVGVTELIDANSNERHEDEGIEKRLRRAEIEKARLEGALEAVRQLKERTGKDLEWLNIVIERGFSESVTGRQRSQQESLTEEKPDAASISVEGTRPKDAHSEAPDDEEQPLPPGWYYAPDLSSSRKPRWRWRWSARRRGDR
jgi:hypothetical protein